MDRSNRVRNGRRACGFTLIELLVVVSIIALLVSILVPALSEARAAAKTAVCMSNMRQINMACFMYTDEYRNYPPIAAWRVWKPTGQTVSVYWINLLESYLPGYAGWVLYENKFLVCPAAPEFIGTWYANSSYGYNFRSFAYGRGTSNEHINPGGTSYIGLAVVNPEMVKDPAEKIIFGDGAYGAYIPPTTHATYQIDYIDVAGSPSYLSALDRAPTMRHSKGRGKSEPLQGRDGRMMGRACLGYADGHVKADGIEGRLLEYRHWPIR